MTGTKVVQPAPAKLGRRFLSLIYESLLLAALIMAAALPIVMLTSAWPHVLARVLLQAVLIAVCCFYFVWQWTRSGQTLAMKTWRLKLVTQQGGLLTPARAIVRYVLALAGTLFFGIGFLWALVDRQNLFLHDRLGGTLIATAPDE